MWPVKCLSVLVFGKSFEVNSIQCLILNLSHCFSVIGCVYKALQELEQVVKVIMDILECRIERTLESMASTSLLTLPKNQPVTPEMFLTNTETTINTARQTMKM